MNKELTIITSKLLMNKLGLLAGRLQSLADPQGSNPNYATIEQIIGDATKILSDFYTRLSEPNYKPQTLISDTIPNADDYNTNFQGIADDLEVLFAEFENLESVVLANFNYMVSRLNRLNAKLKTVYSSLGDYILFANLPTQDAIFFQDSFNNVARVEVDSPLLSQTQCNVNQEEGVVTLPVDKANEVILQVTNVPTINSNSNGTTGNNQEVGAPYNGDISQILDGNADTWFEYERVVTPDDGVPLVLDFTINVGDPKIINFIRINPNNFGTRTQVEVVNIDTSLDGQAFTSIKDDIPLAGFAFTDDPNIFVLAPSTSKYAGQGLYTFSPRKVKFIRITLSQSTPYIIHTSTADPLATKYRYAIGIRDVEIKASPYLADGEMISTEFATNDDVRKVALLSNQNPTEGTTSSLASISHYVSPDNGVSWYQLRPAVASGEANVTQSIPEVLNFNGISADSIATANPVRSLRYKAVLHRETSAFTPDAADLAQVIGDYTEMHVMPDTTPFEMTLVWRPIDGTISVMDPMLGSAGKEDVRYYVAKGNGGKLKVKLPFAPLQADFAKVYQGGRWTLQNVDPQNIYVNGELWTRSSFRNPKSYKLSFQDGWLEFGDLSASTLDAGTSCVPNNAVVSMTLNEKPIFPGVDAAHKASLPYPVALDKDRISIDIVHPTEATTTPLIKGASVHPLNKYIDQSFEPIPSSGVASITDSGTMTRRVAFIDGASEFISGGNYSIDFTNGMLYTSQPLATTSGAYLTYRYAPRETLSSLDWQFGAATGDQSTVSISNSKFVTFPPDTSLNLNVPNNVRQFDFPNMGIVPGSVSFKDTNTGAAPAGCLDTEVTYVDGNIEVYNFIRTTEKIADPLLAMPLPAHLGTQAVFNWVAYYKFQLRPAEYDDDGDKLQISFSNTDVFRNRVYTMPENRGDYLIEFMPVAAGAHPEAGCTAIVWVNRGQTDTEVIPVPIVYQTKQLGFWNWTYTDHVLTVPVPVLVTHADIVTPNPGKVTYYYKDYQRDTQGRYSVDYRKGQVFMGRKLPTGLSGRVRMNYQYTNYVAQFDVGRHVIPANWTYDATKNSITINDNEKLNSIHMPQTAPETAAQKYYRVSYKYVKEGRPDAPLLEPYFSPVLKDYALKVVTKSRLI